MNPLHNSVLLREARAFPLARSLHSLKPCLPYRHRQAQRCRDTKIAERDGSTSLLFLVYLALRFSGPVFRRYENREECPPCRRDSSLHGLRRQVNPWAQHLPILIVAAINAHPGALVQPRRAGQVLGISVQGDLTDPPRVELAK